MQIQADSNGSDIALGAIEKAIDGGISYLHQHQYPNGEFCCYMSGDIKMEEWAIPDCQLFTTALIARALLSAPTQPLAEEILTKCTLFFEYHAKMGMVWHTYSPWNIYYKITPFDVDATVVVSYILRARKSWMVKYDNLPILRANSNRQGLFYTWFAPRLSLTTNKKFWKLVLPRLLNPVRDFLFWSKQACKRNSIDAVVNAHALLYIGNQPFMQPVKHYLTTLIENNQEKESDVWYPNPLVLYYALGRNYHEGVQGIESVRNTCIERILQHARPDGQLGETVLDTALAVTALIYWRSHPPALHAGIRHLLQQQRPHGDWKKSMYFLGPTHEIGWGSEELTTAICIEALAEYRKLMANG